ncbi:PRD domain-containing protein [Microbacterium betulae]|uniref:PRD domain-containing protein n=1 Tax=Microbacterium betulae TaxID=2981139 RepID=A0AA97FJ23_9MICO|nr:PRD domain-containing protein [Microbacterium sp. AB]WOF23584.1 PRD domain-containing protein [Microbacterium sp. AB]
MIVRRVLNNSVVDALDDAMREVIVLGRGIGFHAHPGDHIDPASVEKVFRLDDSAQGTHLAQVAAHVPADILRATDEIVTLARDRLSERLSDSIYAALADHLAFAVQRAREDVDLASALEGEVRRFYPNEYAVALEALAVVERATGTTMPSAEAANVALHLITAEVGGGDGSAAALTTFTRDVLDIVRLRFGISYDDADPAYARFATHVRYFAQRVLSGTEIDRDDADLMNVLREQMPRVFAVIDRIDAYTRDVHDHAMTSTEKVYIAMHVSRFV